MTMNIILASDHAGFALKESIKAFLVSQQFNVLDVGAQEFLADDDYPAYMKAAAAKVLEDKTGEKRAILFGGSGQGEAMVANRFPGVRAAVWYGDGEVRRDLKTSAISNANSKACSNLIDNNNVIKLSRWHNDANILSIGAWFVDEEEAKSSS